MPAKRKAAARSKRSVKGKANTHVSRVHHHWRKSHYENVLHFSIAPRYQPIKGFSFLEGTLAIMLATFSFTIMLGSNVFQTAANIEGTAQTVTVHQVHHSPLYTYFKTNPQVEVFTRG